MRLSHVRRTIALAAVVSGTALAVAGPAGAHTAINDPHEYGEWIADVERPAEHYRGRYQVKLGQARTLLAEVPVTERGVDV
jgi:hypothetical protein